MDISVAWYWKLLDNSDTVKLLEFFLSIIGFKMWHTREGTLLAGERYGSKELPRGKLRC